MGDPSLGDAGRSEEFARAIHAVYDAFVNRLGVYCWSAVFAFPPIGKRGDKESQ